MNYLERAQIHMSSTKSKLAPRHTDNSQTPLDRLLHNLHTKKAVEDSVSLPKLKVHDSERKNSELMIDARNSIHSNGGKSVPGSKSIPD